MSDDFDWSPEAEHIIVPSQAAIACYTNPAGALVIRQEGQYHPDEDSWIVVTRCHVLKLCRAMLIEAGLDFEIVPTDQPADEPKPKDTKDAKAAERMRRYRRRHRNDEPSVTPTDRNGVTAPDRDAIVTQRDGANLFQLPMKENGAA